MTQMKKMPDWRDVQGFALQDIAWCINNNIIGGSGPVGAKRIMLGNKATRAEMAKIITVTVRDVLR